MGVCASSQITRRGGAMKWPPTAMIIASDGELQEFRQPIKAGQILSQNPNCFLCSSETMFVGSHPPPMPDDEELQLGQIYFLMPISKSQAPLSLQDLCALAIKASAALNNSIIMGQATTKISPFSELLAGPQACSNIPTGFDMVGMNSPVVARGNQRIEFYDKKS